MGQLRFRDDLPHYPRCLYRGSVATKPAKVAKAIDYMLSAVHWPSFTRFLEDGRFCLTNNAAERSLRGVALGRKSWLFAGSERGGQRPAAMLRPHRCGQAEWHRPAGIGSPMSSPGSLTCQPQTCRIYCHGAFKQPKAAQSRLPDGGFRRMPTSKPIALTVLSIWSALSLDKLHSTTRS